MAKLLAMLLLCVSATHLSWASSQETLTPMLSKEEEGNPQAVADWLRKHGSRADQATARKSFEEGLKRKQRKDWGAAIKAFGDSVGFYPTPRAFNELAEARLQLLREIRQRKSAPNSDWRRDIQEAELSYRNSLAADAVIKQLTREERRQTELNVGCLNRYVESEAKPHNCPPLTLYGLGP